MRARRAALALVLAGCAGLLLQLPADALPAGTPKVGMVCKNGPTFDLVANKGYAQTPDGNSVFMWSYSLDGDPDYPTFQTPGPVICVTQGQTVTIHLRNTLPEPVSIVFPGQDSQVAATGTGPNGLFAKEAAASGGTVTYSFVAGQPGTYLYESGSNVSKQVEMGLYGALVVRPSSGADHAYDSASTQFDPAREYLILLADIDPALHHAVETGGDYDFSKVHNRYFTVNGRGFPDTIQDNGSALLPNQPYGALVRLQPTTASSNPALIRMLNAGIDNHPFHPHGNHMRQIAQDGRLLLSPTGGDASTERFGETIASGETEDYLIRWDDQLTGDNWNPTTNPLPVAQPNYRELTFKDGNTWYSGSPYLGYKGTLPTGTTSQNVCGEWYFPWHSHALNEFTNFDEGFGGMATLLRVDPPGGCFAAPTSAAIQAGTLNAGTFAALAEVDQSYYKVNSTTTNPTTTDWYAQFSGVPAGAGNLQVTYIGNNVFGSSGCAASQDFNTLASSGSTGTTRPTCWESAEGTTLNPSYGVSNGSSGTANTYSYGSTGSTDRAFGTLLGNGNNPTTLRVGASFVNTTGSTIHSLTISYTGEQWRHEAYTGGADRLDFQYSTSSPITQTSGWTDFNTLDFVSPVATSTGGDVALDGNANANRTAISATITGLNIPNNGTFRIRWNDFNRPSSNQEDGLAVDEFSITPLSTLPTGATTFSVWNWASSAWSQVNGTVNIGVTDTTVTLSIPSAGGSWAPYVGTGANSGRVRVRVLTQDGSTTFVTAADLMKLNYDAP